VVGGLKAKRQRVECFRGRSTHFFAQNIVMYFKKKEKFSRMAMEEIKKI